MIVVAPATPGDLDAAATVLAEAFVDDPVTGPLLGRGGERTTRARHLFVALLRPVIAGGTVDLARRDGHDEVLGVAIWESPGTDTRLPDLLRQAPSFWRACGPGRLWLALRTKRAVDRQRPGRAHWYLQEIGVSAAARGQGVGGALLDARLARIDAEDGAAYLESSSARNRRLYHRHGFVDIAPVPGIEAAPMSMWRAPLSERAARPAAPQTGRPAAPRAARRSPVRA